MAGKRQHYLPRFLQRGFVSSPQGERTWLYRKGISIKEVGIRGIGVEDYFYSDAANSGLDDSITKAETEEFGKAVNYLRQGASAADHISHLARLISHLEVRSKNLREGFEETASKLWNRTAETLQDPKVLRAIFESRELENPTRLVGEAEAQLRQRGLPISFAPDIATLAAKQLSSAGDNYFSQLWGELLPILKLHFGPALSRAVKTAHQSALQKSIAPEVRIANYERLTFHNVEIPGGNLLLGDSAVLFELTAKKNFKPFLDKDAEFIRVFLPIASDRVIIGGILPDDVDEKLLRLGAARTALRFFIAAKNDEETVQLRAEIGADALPLSDSELNEIVMNEILKQLNPSSDAG